MVHKISFNPDCRPTKKSIQSLSDQAEAAVEALRAKSEGMGRRLDSHISGPHGVEISIFPEGAPDHDPHLQRYMRGLRKEIYEHLEPAGLQPMREVTAIAAQKSRRTRK